MVLIILPGPLRRRNYKQRRDQNEPEIVAALERHGLPVQRLEPPAPDLLVGTRERTLVLLEVKDPDPSKRYGKRVNLNLTAGQQAWHAKWRGWPVFIVKTPAEALKAAGVGR